MSETHESVEATLKSVEATLMEWVDEALELRHGPAGDPQGPLKGTPQETPAEVMDLLRRVRSRSDRVDELLSKITLARGKIRRAKEEAAFVADQALMVARQQRAVRRVEFSSGIERDADAKLDTFEQRRVAFQRDRLVSVANDAFEVITQVHWQLDAIRKDLRGVLHALQFESSLER